MNRELRNGLWVAVASFVLWGLLPLFWRLLRAVPPLEIVAHRVVWSTLVVVAWLCWRKGRHWFRLAIAQPRAAWMLALSGVLIAFSWSLYIWAVNAGHVVECSLGYFINPLLNVVMGVAFLRERLRRAQWVSVALAAAGVIWLTVQYGQLPWIALGLALSFGLYGLVRKLLSTDPVTGLGVESVYLVIPALIALVWGEMHGQGGFLDSWGLGTDLLLFVGGVLTAAPLIGFAYAVRRVPLSVVGLLQYVSPTLQFLTGVFLFKETFDRDHLIGFVFIWAALLVFVFDGLRQLRRPATAPAPTPVPATNEA